MFDALCTHAIPANAIVLRNHLCNLSMLLWQYWRLCDKLKADAAAWCGHASAKDRLVQDHIRSTEDKLYITLYYVV